MLRSDQNLRKLQNMDAETSDVTLDAEMSEEIAEAWANVLVDLHSDIDHESEEHHTPMEETEPCESNSNAHPCQGNRTLVPWKIAEKLRQQRVVIPAPNAFSTHVVFNCHVAAKNI